MTRLLFAVAVSLCVGHVAGAHSPSITDDRELIVIQAWANSKEQRNKISNLGIAIDGVQQDSVTIYGTNADVQNIRKLGIRAEVANVRGFPTKDAAFHDYKETMDELDLLAKNNPELVTRIAIGKSLEGRELMGVRISSNPTADSLPSAIFIGCHHAREHLSVEVPLMIAKHLVENYARSERIKKILDSTELYVIPMLNPDGAEYDIATGSYRSWRKNRRNNGGGTFGVDLNRNYGGGFFGGPGSSASPSSDIYHGPSEFSEPETAAVRDFVRARKRATVLLSFHTFSELVLWPFGHTDDPIPNETDRKVFETMGNKMASWNHYKPQKASELYLASGDTTDWAYSELKLFAFTFELSPSSIFGGGFYPGAKAIKPTFEANLEPALYLLEATPNPYAVVK